MNIKVKGTGLTSFGELWNKSLTDLIEEATNKALTESNLTIDDIDHIYVGSMIPGETENQSHVGSVFSSIYDTHVPAIRIEAACASGGLAVHQAIQTLRASDTKKNILVVGAEKMTDHCQSYIASLLMQAASEEERESGITFPGLYALIARMHMHTFGTTEEQFALASVMSHKNAMSNPHAQFQREISLENVLHSSSIALPLKLLDCSPISDGAAAIVISNEDPVPDTNEAYILDSVCTTDTLSLSQRKSLVGLESTAQASQQIFTNNPQISHKDIDLIEIHDCFSIATLIALEDMGFAEKGHGGKALEQLSLGSLEYPQINVSGGLKACGHPVGATGVKQIAEIAQQIQNKAHGRQLENVEYGLSHNIGGTGATCVMHLLAKNPKLS